MNVEFHPAAQEELTEAVHYYEEQRRFLGERLLSATEEALRPFTANKYPCQDTKRPYSHCKSTLILDNYF